VHVPLAHASPLDPHDCPSGAVLSAGHVALLPEQTSAKSHCASTAARHTVPEEAYWQELVQHAELDGSHTAPDRNLHAGKGQRGQVG
jgi:hypothetical protein